VIREDLPPHTSALPEGADLRCIECGERVTALSAVISDLPVHSVNAGVWAQAGPRVLGWITVPCMHFVDTDIWTLSYRVSAEGFTATFERRGAAKP
jgi:hypothetical protein